MAATALLLVGGCAPRSEPDFDLLISGATLIDPGGSSVAVRDLAVAGDRIAAIGDLAGKTAQIEIDGSGLHLAPGFIDSHSHTADALIASDRSGAEALLYQGITTVVINPDGHGPIDLVQQRQELLEHPLGINVAQMIGHGSVRREVLGMEDRAPNEDEMAAMAQLVRDAMNEGAFGLSSGPFYAPGSYSETDELVALARVAGDFGGVYQSHIRDESNYTIGLEAAVTEVITVAEQADVTGIVTHIKALGPPVWGSSETIVDSIEAARARGIRVFADQYPYPASATGLGAALVPRWAQADGHDAFRSRLGEPEQRRRIVSEMHQNLARRGGADRIQFRHVPGRSELEGQTLAAVAGQAQIDPVDLSLQLLSSPDGRGDVGIVSFNMNENDVETFMAQPWTMTASDGAYPVWGEGVPHPRGFGTFPRRIRRYSLDKPVLPLPDTIRSMTSLPAEVFGLDQRGVLAVGAFADLVLFDLERLRDTATFEEPYQLAEGVVLVLVNGQPALSETGDQPLSLAGLVLSRSTQPKNR